MRKTSVKNLLVFPALSLVVATGCAPIDSSSSTSVGDTSSTVEGNSDASGDQQNSTDTTIAPKGSSASGSSNVDANGAQVPDTTTGTRGNTPPPESQSSTGVFALSVLERIVQDKEVGNGYSRDLFRHWSDADGDQCNTREEVLIAESLSRAQVDAFGCKVIAGDWFSPFDGLSHTDPSDLDIDHLVPLKEAWDSGAHAWSSSKRERFANDLSDGRVLIAVTSGVNRSKGDRDPSQWLPPRGAYTCTYVSDWIAVKFQWGLSMDSSEWGRLKNLLNGQCAGTTIAAWETSSTPEPPQAPSSPAPAEEKDENPTDAPALPTIRPGAFCTPEGGLGTYSERVYVCAKTRTTGEPYGDGRARWRQQ
ncbi:unannotated protein [freshwater metagenome]|uniref:Unannotated protein n=1 Tax=freshwater metagenome TaxID=449393 RepID=A0A6J6DR61_9ZZZZ